MRRPSAEVPTFSCPIKSLIASVAPSPCSARKGNRLGRTFLLASVIFCFFAFDSAIVEEWIDRKIDRWIER